MLKQKDDESVKKSAAMPAAGSLSRGVLPFLLSFDGWSRIDLHRHYARRKRAPQRVGSLDTIGSARRIGVMAATIYICYGFADRLAKFLDRSAMTVIMRLSSFF